MLNIRQLFCRVPQIWILTDVHGKVLLTSDYFESFQYLLPVPVREGDCIFDSVPDSWQGFAANMIDSLRSGHSSSLEVSYPEENGKETYFEIKFTGIIESDASSGHIFIEARDVTLQKIFEKKITIVAREYEDMVENANAIIIGVDSKGYITDWNVMASETLGYSKNECYSKILSDFFVPESQEEYARMVDHVCSGNVKTNLELAARAQSGKRLTLLINATPKKNSMGQVVGIFLIGQDITELSVYRQSLEQQVKEHTSALRSALEKEKKLVEVKDRFVSMASHEFRSPINYIHRNIEIIRSQAANLSTQELEARLGKIQAQAENLSSLLEDVLAIGKESATETGMKANVKFVDLTDFLFGIIDEVQTNTQHSHAISFHFPETRACLLSDEKLLRNIFINLFTNAIKFSPGRDRIEVRVHQGEGYLEVQVQDWGLGIEEEEVPKVFDAFYRGKNVQSIKGTGLGLSIVKKAVDALGGTIAVGSVKGQGTQFTVKLNVNIA